MARMYPPEPFDNGSAAEVDIFRRIRLDLPDEWIALHSLGLADHPRKPWAEIDFVLIGPPGIFCLEVKGGRVRRENGYWRFTDRYDRTTSKREGPFEQVGTASSVLFKRLTNEVSLMNDIAVGYGVLTPDQPWTEQGPDILCEVVYDERDKGKSFAAYVRRLAAYWSERLEQQRHGRPLESLDDRARAALLDFLRGDFDLRPSLRSRMAASTQELFALTKAQYKVLDGLEQNPRAIITGGAGSGKTLLAAEEARRHASVNKRVFFCCYNKRLASFLREALRNEPKIDVYHLHGFMRQAIDDAGLTPELPKAEERDLFDVFYPRLCLEALDVLGKLESCDVLIVDEAQDLLRNGHLDVFDMLLKGSLEHGVWRLFLDPFQDLFRGTTVTAPQRLLNTVPVQFRLTVNCRNTAPIGTAAALLSGMDCHETLSATGPEIETDIYSDAGEERRLVSRCINRYLSQGVPPSDIVVLSKYRLANSGLQDGLINVPFPLVEMDDHGFPPGSKAIQYTTIGSFKGLEADVVVVADIDDLEDSEALSSVYVGATRAKTVLAYFRDAKTDTQYKERAVEFGRREAARMKESDPLW